MGKTIFEKYGGLKTISHLVHEFYKKVLDDPQLKGYFSNSNIEKLMEHQANFLSFALGGPNLYQGRDLIDAHKSLHIKKPHFELVANYLEEVLDEAGVSDEDIIKIMKIIQGTESQIIDLAS